MWVSQTNKLIITLAFSIWYSLHKFSRINSRFLYFFWYTITLLTRSPTPYSAPKMWKKYNIYIGYYKYFIKWHNYKAIFNAFFYQILLCIFEVLNCWINCTSLAHTYPTIPCLLHYFPPFLEPYTPPPLWQHSPRVTIIFQFLFACVRVWMQSYGFSFSHLFDRFFLEGVQS